MSNRNKGYNKTKNSEQDYDKHEEHLDHSTIGKIQQQYWTAKQQVIKKFGKKEDEYVILSDAELDAKLDLFETIEQTSIDLLRIIELYQDQIINLSIEESEMSTFLKSQSTYDTKTKAGKMMAAVSKAQHFAAQHRNSLRLPLIRLYNEVETFRYRAVADTFLTIRKMENARTEYRGALLWMKNISTELDPDASRKLEKFRRVQAQVKKTKTKFDRLKIDVTQKVDMLSASRCNMFSHVLANYQRTLILFWTKTAKTFSAVAEAFKGYDHYEFNIIKNLVEPSRRKIDELHQAEKENSENDFKLEDRSIISENKDILIDFDTPEALELSSEKTELDQNFQTNDNGVNKSVDEVNELIDLMTLNEANSLNEQLKELEILEQQKKNQATSKDINTKNRLKDVSNNKLNELNKFTTNPNDQDTSVSSVNLNMDFQKTAFKEILSNASDEFEREWQSAFINSNDPNNSTSIFKLDDPQTSDHMPFFSQINKSIKDVDSNKTGPETKLDLFDNGNNIDCSLKQTSPTNTNTSSQISKSQSEIKKKNLSNWYDLFAELDPIKNPDAIGQQEGFDEERNC